jgi:hypothetical protein
VPIINPFHRPGVFVFGQQAQLVQVLKFTPITPALKIVVIPAE